MLLSRGKAISGAPICTGTKQLPNPPTNLGITIKKIIRKACAVMITLYNWWFPFKICTPGEANSIRINTENAVPNIPLKIAKIK